MNQSSGQDVIPNQDCELTQGDVSLSQKLKPHTEQHSLSFPLQPVMPSTDGLIQRSPGVLEENHLIIWAYLGEKKFVTYSFQLSNEQASLLGTEPELIEEMESVLTNLLNSASGPIHESPLFLMSPQVNSLVGQDLAMWPYDKSMPNLAEFLARRMQTLEQQSLLYRAEQYLEATIGINPGIVDWQSVILLLMERQPFEVITLVDASHVDKYQMFLRMLLTEATVVDSPGAGVELLDLLEKTLIHYSLGLEPEELTGGRYSNIQREFPGALVGIYRECSMRTRRFCHGVARN